MTNRSKLLAVYHDAGRVASRCACFRMFVSLHACSTRIESHVERRWKTSLESLHLMACLLSRVGDRQIFKLPISGFREKKKRIHYLTHKNYARYQTILAAQLPRMIIRLMDEAACNVLRKIKPAKRQMTNRKREMSVVTDGRFTRDKSRLDRGGRAIVRARS